MDASVRRGAGEPCIRLLCYVPPRALGIDSLAARAQDYDPYGTAILAASELIIIDKVSDIVLKSRARCQRFRCFLFARFRRPYCPFIVLPFPFFPVRAFLHASPVGARLRSLPSTNY